MVDAYANFLTEALHPDNCVGILQLADTHSRDTLRTRVQNFLIQNFPQVVTYEEILVLPEEIFCNILKSNELSVTEKEQVMSWVQSRENERLSLLPHILKHVRLPLLDPWYFVERVEGDKLIRKCPEVFPLLQDARMYHLSGNEAKCINAVTFKDHIYVVGGAMKVLYSYSPVEDSWSLVTRFSHEKASCGIAACRNKLFVTGGRDKKNKNYSEITDQDVRSVTKHVPVDRSLKNDYPLTPDHRGSPTVQDPAFRRSWKGRKEPSFKPRVDYQPPDVPFQTVTQYKQDFKPWPIPKKENFPWISNGGKKDGFSVSPSDSPVSQYPQPGAQRAEKEERNRHRWGAEQLNTTKTSFNRYVL
ncbi:UNVERIFIED_CONTAM: hypothetical protein FKN15_032642 [Acipenser sinensis]